MPGHLPKFPRDEVALLSAAHWTWRGSPRASPHGDASQLGCGCAALSEACEKTGWQVHAYCLVSSHFHLVAETPQPNRVGGMKWLLGTDTGPFNRRHQYLGHLFQEDSAEGRRQFQRRLRRETPLTRRWIAERLPIGSASCVSRLLRKPDPA